MKRLEKLNYEKRIDLNNEDSSRKLITLSQNKLMKHQHK